MTPSLPEPALDDLLRRHLRMVPPHRALMRTMDATLMRDVPLCGPVLDVGCGDGLFATLAYSRRIDVGTDLPMAMLPRVSIDAARRSGAYRSVVTASATALPFADASFRTVLSNSVVEHIADLDGTLAEIARVLTPRGTFAFTTPSEHFGDLLLVSSVLRRLHLRLLAAAYARWFDGLSRHRHRYGPAAWREKLTTVGLEVRTWRYYGSARTHRVFDACHYLGIPNLLCRVVTGRWVPSTRWGVRCARWLLPYADMSPCAAGAYLFFVCEKGDTPQRVTAAPALEESAPPAARRPGPPALV